MPLRLHQRPNGPDAVLYRRFAFGDLMDLIMLDERQYRAALPCPPAAPAPDRNRVVLQGECPQASEAGRSMLGDDQERWLAQCVSEPARARWLVIGQQLLFAPFLWKRDNGLGFDTDGWGGYAAAHQALIDLIAKRPNRDTLVIGADVHAFVAAHIPSRQDDFSSSPIATHVGCGPISSRLANHEAYMKSLPSNPHIAFVDAQRHGYTRCTLEPDRARFEFRVLDDVREAATGISTLAAFERPWGSANLKRA